MPDIQQHNFAGAVADFRRARREAALQQILGRLQGRPSTLVDYDDVVASLDSDEVIHRGLQSIPLDAIVGSVNRSADFTRTFLPRRATDEERWARVKYAMRHAGGLPPIDVYQIGEVYFVQDGNHRVSVARRHGDSHIQAYVTEIVTNLALSPDDDPDQIICKARYGAFLAQTGLKEARPDADLYMTICGRYDELLQEIRRHQAWLEEQSDGPLSWRDAVIHWYENEYLPVVELIRSQGLLRDFPQRTEADLYLWLERRQVELADALGWTVAPETAAQALVDERRGRGRLLSRLGERVREVVLPSGPRPGNWRSERLSLRRTDSLFVDILCSIESTDTEWLALGQAVEVARLEAGRILGLHVTEKGAQASNEKADLEAEFARRCAAAEVPGDLVFVEGPGLNALIDRVRWTDLMVIKLDYPPGELASDRYFNDVANLIRHSARPVLNVPSRVTSMARPLLAYDGSPNAREALYVATYVAGRWKRPLAIVTIGEGERAHGETLAEARRYVTQYGVRGTFMHRSGVVAQEILKAAESFGADMILMGGYGHSPVVEVMLGSAVDEVLRKTDLPVLICR